MKIKTNTPHAFVANRRSGTWTMLLAPLGMGFVWLFIYAIPQRHPLWVYLLIGFFAAIILFCAFAGPRREQIVFDAAAGTVQIRQKSITGYQNHSFDLANVQSVEFALPRNTTAVTPQTAPEYHLDLRVSGGMDAGDHRIAMNHLPRHKAIALRDAINAWIAQARP